ncbi:unnamed protein product [Rotaria sordida]|uniref:Uncharacterized protein n=1 Tax=Rotaria sordida TaxID=392033 RepID=A0A815MLY3_9BILA|nr:unnamed protein product [Rotaria sordida]
MIEYTHTIELIKNRIKQLEINQYNKFNFDKHLLEIDINSTNIINDFNQRQQELIQLINEDQHTFTKLEQRWQLIIKTILNKQQEIKDIIKLWLSYQNYLEKKESNDLQRSPNEINIYIKQRSETLITLLVRYNELDHALDDVSISIKSIRTLQQQPTDELNQFILQCQNKDRELTQDRHELERLRQRIREISPELHPDDIDQLMQKLNVFEIQWTDAERIIKTLIDNLTKKRSEYDDFENKSKRLIEWFEHFLNTEINHRIDGLTLEATARLLQTDITDQLQLQTLKQQIDRLEQQKNMLKNVLKMFDDFEQGLENLRSWMDTIETNLQKSLSINTLNENQLRDHQQSIILCNKKDSTGLDTQHLSWINVQDPIKRASKMITDHQPFLNQVKRTCRQGLQGLKNEYKTLENFKRTLDNDEKDIQQIRDNYSEIIRNHPRADSTGEIR